MHSAIDPDHILSLDDMKGEDARPSRFALRGNMGTVELLFTVLAFTAPLGVVFGFLSFNIRFGIGVPIAFICVTVLMMFFAMGFTSMTKAVARPGAFYTYIAQGLGRPMGLGGSFLALTAYWFNITAALVFSGIAVNNLIFSFSGSTDTPWWIWSVAMLLIVWAMSYFNVEFSAKLLSAVLAIEVMAIALFDIVLINNGGPEGHSLEPWSPSSLISPSIGLLLLFSVGLFNGFEATAIYRDEVREPEKTIPRATYLAILFLGIFYAISSYALILSEGVSQAVAQALRDPAAMMPHALLIYFGAFANQVIAVLLVTSMLASTLALQNILARYTHSLSVDGVFPTGLAKVHPVHGSPHRSAMAVGLASFIVLLVLIASGANEQNLYGAAAGVAFYGMLLLLLLTAIAVVVYFRRNRQSVSVWMTLVAPTIAGIGIAIELVVATNNLELLIVAPSAVIFGLAAISWIAILIGVAVALFLKWRKSPVYERIGRQID